MVSLWPWKSDENSTASFEKTLSALAAKISRTATAQHKLAAQSRRFKALWTLYTSFAYILSLAILLLVTGWRNWDLYEYAGVLGSPVFIYVVRAGLTAYYTFRLSKAQAHLDDLNAQRDTAVDKFKAATKYDTTQQLLEKYGAAGKESPKSSLDDPSSLTRRKSGRYSGGGAAGQMPARTGLAPPPTANIRRPGDGDRSSVPGTPVRMPTPFVEGFLHQSRLPRSSPQSSPRFPPTTSLEPGAEFAPNAFDSPFNPPAPQSYITGVHAGPSRWYDRILDVLLGEDENRPGDGAVLICQECRLVNGQLPPGVKSLEDLGAWRCQGCRAWNGRRSETHRALGEKVDASLADAETRAEVAAEVAETAAKIDGHSDEEGSDITGEQDSTPARSTRSRTKSSKTGS